MSEVKDALLRTAAILETKGWTQRVYESEEGKYCLIGALEQATGGLQRTPLFDKARGALLNVLHEGIITFNDEPGRTAEEVISVVREVAEGVPA